MRPRSPEPIFDVEIHAVMPRDVMADHLPSRFRDRFLKGYTGIGKLNFDQRGGNNRTDIRVPQKGGAASAPSLIREDILDPLNIEWAIITGTMYNVSIYHDIDYGTAVAAAFNRTLIEEFLQHDDAFLASLVVNWQDPAAAVEEIEKWSTHPRVAQLVTSTSTRETHGSRRFDPIYAAAAKHRLPVAYHTTTEGRGCAPLPNSAGYPSRYLEYHSALACSAIGFVAGMITNGAFARHPGLRVVLLEGGICWALPLIWQLDQDWELLKEEYPDLTHPPSHYLREHCYFTTQPIEEPENGRDLLRVYRAIGLDRNIVYSTDYPHWDFDAPDRFLPSCFSPEERRRILYGNALELYRHRLPEAVK